MSHGAGDAGACGVPDIGAGAQAVPPVQPVADRGAAAVHQLSPQQAAPDVLSSLLHGASAELVRISGKDHEPHAFPGEGTHDPRDLGIRRRLVPYDHAHAENPSQTGTAA